MQLRCHRTDKERKLWKCTPWRRVLRIYKKSSDVCAKEEYTWPPNITGNGSVWLLPICLVL
eukprot:1140685-Pelagomonas_calceolata.AAC.3